MATKSLKVMPKSVFAELPQTYNLSKEQLQFYDDNGYLVIKELVDFATLYSVKQRFVQICKGLVDKGGIRVIREPALVEAGLKGERAVNKIQDILFDDVFNQYIENSRVLHVVAQLIPGDTKKLEDVSLVAMHSMFINKPPGTTRHPPHQDLFYFPFRPAHKITAAWTAIEHVTLNNGALYVVPGSHKAGRIYGHGNTQDHTKALYHGITEEQTVAPEDQRISLAMSPGDTVFFHPLLVHGSGPNTTERYRKSISCHYANGECYYVDVKGTEQELIAEQIKATARKQGFDLSLQDMFRYRKKQVKGNKSNL